MFRGDPVHTGVYADTGAGTTGQLAWRFKAADLVNVNSSPAASGSLVYVGSEDGDLHAVK